MLTADDAPRAPWQLTGDLELGGLYTQNPHFWPMGAPRFEHVREALAREARPDDDQVVVYWRRRPDDFAAALAAFRSIRRKEICRARMVGREPVLTVVDAAATRRAPAHSRAPRPRAQSAAPAATIESGGDDPPAGVVSAECARSQTVRLATRSGCGRVSS